MQDKLSYGMGDPNADFRVYIQNRPDFYPYDQCDCTLALQNGEIAAIGQACGNGWRKVFNVYAKLVYTLDNVNYPWIAQSASWQDYRDEYLLQHNSNTALLFSRPSSFSPDSATIVMGKHFAKSLALPFQLEWLDDYFAINRQHNCIVCPYFDYRQLSNIKIIRLAELINSCLSGPMLK